MSQETSKIIDLFIKYGHSEYGGEAVTQIEHALQAAYFAEEAGEPETLILACLLHDIGHLLHQLPNDAPENGIDDLHENLGFEYLKQSLPLSISEPIKLHVDAKRYLCTKEPDYFHKLSQPSITSLMLQGGPMTEEECIEFEKNEFFQEGIRLRKYDDMAKIPNLPTLQITDYADLLYKYLNE